MNLEKALLDPSSEFANPQKVCDEPNLTNEQKIKILRRWEYDARELEVADEENMGGGGPDILDQILAAIHQLQGTIETENTPPTKQGGE